MNRLSIIAFFFVLLSCQKQYPIAEFPDRLKDALSSIEVMDGFKVELVVAEPLVADPVAMEIDENGDWFVVEMHGYPLDLSKSGCVKKLFDTNADGLPDESIIYADSLLLPTGVMKWKNGIIVTDAPNVLYFEDTDGDHIADVRDTLLTGFALSNPQHNLNTPRFELDNWIYLAHEGVVTPFVHKEEFGDYGQEIRYPAQPFSKKLGINANGRAVRFKPDTHEVEALSGETQFGHTADFWGHRFYTSNADHLFHEVIAEKYTSYNSDVLIPDATNNIPDHGDAAKVFPITQSPNHQLLTDVGVITSSCGVTWYEGGKFGEPFDNVTFIAEPVHNLVHADIIKSDGASFTATRLLENKEFLASTDPWFRPVNFYTGPDGALYVIDYYRQIVEHPEWMSDETNQSGALYNGIDKGRIYRVTPDSGLPMNWLNKPQLTTNDADELVKNLSNTNGWYRRTAQRLLHDKSVSEIEPLLRQQLTKSNPHGTLRALWLLHNANKINETDLLTGLKHTEAGVRENALIIAEKLSKLHTSEVIKTIKQLVNDPDLRVQFQLVCSSAFIPDLAQERLALLSQHPNSIWFARAAAIASKNEEESLFSQLIKNTENKLAIRQFAATITAKKSSLVLKTILSKALTEEWQYIALKGISDVWKNRGRTFEITDNQANDLLSSFTSENSSERRSAILDVLRFTDFRNLSYDFTNIRKLYETHSDISYKSDVVQLLSMTDSGFRSSLLDQLKSEQNEALQTAIINALDSRATEAQCVDLITYYNNLPPTAQSRALQLLSKRKYSVKLLLDGIEAKHIDKENLAWHERVGLMNYYDTEIRQQARRIFAVNEDRKAVLQPYLAAVNMKGDSANGKLIFQQFCTACHVINGVQGVDFGPNLSTLQSRNAHSIITEIIYPNNSIADKYDLWQLSLASGTALSGIVVNQSNDALTLKLMDGTQQVIQRKDITTLEKSTQSAMPNGFENGISVEQMSDLIAFIRKQ